LQKWRLLFFFLPASVWCDAKNKWDTVAAPHLTPRTMAELQTSSLACVNEIVGPGATDEQCSYLDCLTFKPCSVSPRTLWDRLQDMNMLLVPCADNLNSTNDPFSNDCHHLLFEHLQPQAMKDKALEQNNMVSNPNVTDDNSAPESFSLSNCLLTRSASLFPEWSLWWSLSP